MIIIALIIFMPFILVFLYGVIYDTIRYKKARREFPKDKPFIKKTRFKKTLDDEFQGGQLKVVFFLTVGGLAVQGLISYGSQSPDFFGGGLLAASGILGPIILDYFSDKPKIWVEEDKLDDSSKSENSKK